MKDLFNFEFIRNDLFEGFPMFEYVENKDGDDIASQLNELADGDVEDYVSSLMIATEKLQPIDNVGNVCNYGKLLLDAEIDTELNEHALKIEKLFEEFNITKMFIYFQK